MDHGGGERAVGGVRADRLGRGDKDRWCGGGVHGWDVSRRGNNRGERSHNGARTLGDGN